MGDPSPAPRELAARWAAWNGAGDAAERAAGLLANFNRHGIDAVTPGHGAPRDVLEACESRGLLKRIQCVTVDGDGFTIEPEMWVTGWEFAICPVTPAERERLFAWVREWCKEAQDPDYGLPGQPEDHDALAADVAEALGLSTEDATALIDAAKGWPS